MGLTSTRGTYPTTDTVLVFLAHNMVDLQQMTSGIGLNIWSAIAEFHALASAE